MMCENTISCSTLVGTSMTSQTRSMRPASSISCARLSFRFSCFLTSDSAADAARRPQQQRRCGALFSSVNNPRRRPGRLNPTSPAHNRGDKTHGRYWLASVALFIVHSHVILTENLSCKVAEINVERRTAAFCSFMECIIGCMWP